jgi:CubicO group peptidase (beta-lactamase class C family)
MNQSISMTSPAAVGLSSQRLQRIAAVMQAYVEQQKLAGVITLVARHGKIAHWQCFGQADIEANQPMRADTIFRIYSMTKPITSVAAMMLYEEGHFQLDDPVARFLPALAKMKVCRAATASDLQLVEQERPMTVRDLFLHTSGIIDGAPEGSPVEKLYDQADLLRTDRTLQEMVQRLGELPLGCQPGSAWRYGRSTDVLGYLVELMADMPLDDFLARRIFKPLGMVDTGFFVPPEKQDRLAAVYGPGADGGIVRLARPDVTRYTAPQRFLSGGGGLVATTMDYLRFAQLLVNGGTLDGMHLLSHKTVAMMTSNHLSSALLPYDMGFPPLAHFTRGHGFGLGVRVLTDVAQAGVLGSIGEYGWGGAANTVVWIDPKEAMVCLLMVQFMPPGHHPIDRQFKVLVYQALLDKFEKARN